MKNNTKTKTIFFQVSAIVILLSAVLFYFEPTVARYMMIIGVAGYGSTTFTTPYPGKSLRGKRLFNIQVFSVILMAVAAYLMFVANSGWVVILLIASVLTLYCSIALPRVYSQEGKEDNQK